MKKILKIAGMVILVAFTFVAGMIFGTKMPLSIEFQRSDSKACQNYERQDFDVKYIKENNWSDEQFVEDFTEITDIVKKNYSHLESKQINADSLYQVYLGYIKTIKTNDKYNNLLLAYFAELKNGHSNLNLFSSYSINCEAKLIGNRVFIDRVGRSLSIKGINVNDEIIAVDGVPVFEWLNMQQKFVSSSTDKKRLYRTVQHIFFGYSDGIRTLLLNTQKGEKEIALSFVKNARNSITSYTINDSIGYICIYSMQGDVVGEFEKEFDKIRKKPVLIIDIRFNGGGNSNFGDEITEYLIRNEQKACVSGRNLQPKINHYEGKLVVLIGTNTFSAAESFALNLKESGNAILIGSVTSGDTGNRPNNFTTKHGTIFRIPTRKPPQVSPKGFPMEGIGIEPDFTIYQTLDDYLNDIDTILKFAINIVSEVEQE